jgi:serine protease Do
MSFNPPHRSGRRLVALSVIVVILAGCSAAANNNPRRGSTGASSGVTSTTVATTATPASAVTSSNTANTQTVTTEAAPAPASSDDFQSAIRNVAQKVRPSVVQITNQQVQFDQFNQPYNVPAGVGSGVIYDNQGHIMTNNHVVAGAEKLLVSLPDGRSFPATLIGADPQTDLAVVQISGDNLPVATLGDSTQLQVGDWVVAIGNALALPGGPTVTAGVVSALGRTVQEPGEGGGAGPFLFDVVQTSAPINPGNSGGPLMNLASQVVGINTLVAGQAEPGVPAQGIGFAISIATAKPIADQLVATGHVVHPFVGINYVPLTPVIAQQIGTNAKEGIVVANVVPGSPAAAAGLKRGDVITAVEGTPIADASALGRWLSTHKPGDKATLTVIRDGKEQQIDVTLGEIPTQSNQ